MARLTSRRKFIHGSLQLAALSAAPQLALAQPSSVFTVAGTGVAGNNTDTSVEANDTLINNPYGIVPGPDGALYFCEVDTGRIKRLDLASNYVMTVAGTGLKGFRRESRRAQETDFSAPHEIRFDEQGNLYVVERDAHAVRRIAARSGFVSTLAGDGRPGFAGDGSSATLSRLNQPHSIAFDAAGNLLICDIGNSRVREVSRETGYISTLSGTGERLPTPDQGPLDGTPLLGPRSLDTDPNGNAYLVLREGNAVFQLDLSAGTLQRIAGTGEKGYSGDGGSALEATFNGPKGIAYSAAGHSLYIVDTENHVIRRMDLTSGTIETVLGSGQRGDGPDGDPLACMLNRPHGVCVHNRTVYVTDSENHRIRAVSGLIG